MSAHPEKIGVYPIEREVGRGGMGVVYLGRDPRLDRAVAIKVLPAEFAADPERLARFEREARLLASLSHPNIASIHGIEQDGDRRFLVLEYVEGESLSERIDAGALPLDECLEVCAQIAAALEAAHESGVIHRDLKPGNVKLTPAGEVKVLDFGLAKGPAGSADSNPDLSQSPTMTAGATGVGVILGTAAYMSPEQARGRGVDRRTDIWSFGCVLYECLTGRQAFGGDTVSDMIARILQGEADLSLIPAKTPDSVRHLLRRCLEKDPRKRLRDIGDARIELDEAHAALTSTMRKAIEPEVAAASARSSMWRGVAIGALAGILLTAGLLSFMRPTQKASRPTPHGARLTIRIPDDVQLFTQGLELGAPIDVAPDGSSIVILASDAHGTERNVQRLYRRMLDGGTFDLIKGTEGAYSKPRISNDGRQVYYAARVAPGSQEREVRRVPIDGSAPPVTICSMRTNWDTGIPLPSGELLYMHQDGRAFSRVSSTGDVGEPIEIVAEGSPVTFDMNFIGREGVLADDAVLLGTTYFDESGWGKGVAVMNPKTGKATIVSKDAGHAKLLPSGDLLFSRGDVLLVAPYDAGRRALTGEPRAMLNGIRTFGQFVAGRFELSESGLLVFPTGGRIAEQRALATITPDGHVREWPDSRKVYNWNWPPYPTKDGKQCVMTVTNARGVDEIWMTSIETPFLRRIIAVDDGDAGSPVLSQDHQWVAYRLSPNDERDGLYVRRVDGSGVGTRIVERGDSRGAYVVCWLPDNSGVVVGWREAGRRRIMLVRFDGEPGESNEIVPLFADSFDNVGGDISPDGRWITFTSDRSGRRQVYVAPLTSSGAGRATPVTRTGGSARFQGMNTIAFVDSSEILKRIHVELGETPRAGGTERLLNLSTLRVAAWNPLPDGNFIAIMEGGEEFRVTNLEVLIDWEGRLAEALAN